MPSALRPSALVLRAQLRAQLGEQTFAAAYRKLSAAARRESARAEEEDGVGGGDGGGGGGGSGGGGVEEAAATTNEIGEDDALVGELQRILGAGNLTMLPLLLKLVYLEAAELSASLGAPDHGAGQLRL